MSSTLALKTIEIAKTQLGVQEEPKGSNAGVAVEKYLKSVGLSKGYPWCMAFVYWCVAQACAKLALKNPLVKTGGVLAQWNGKQELRQAHPQIGDIFIMDYGKGLGHCGFVEKVLPDGTLQTIEGNTNSFGSREGYEVCRRQRKGSACKGFLNF